MRKILEASKITPSGRTLASLLASLLDLGRGTGSSSQVNEEGETVLAGMSHGALSWSEQIGFGDPAVRLLHWLDITVFYGRNGIDVASISAD